jgi:hypothetical protein
MSLTNQEPKLPPADPDPSEGQPVYPLQDPPDPDPDVVPTDPQRTPSTDRALPHNNVASSMGPGLLLRLGVSSARALRPASWIGIAFDNPQCQLAGVPL